MLKLLKYFKTKDTLMSLTVIVFVVGQVMCDLTLPDYMGYIVKSIQSMSPISDVWYLGGIMMGIVLASISCTIIASYFAAKVGARLASNVRRRMFDKVNNFSMDEMNRFSESSLITRCTNDITQMQMMVIMLLRFAVSAPVMAIGAIIKIVGKNLELSMATLAAIVLMLVMIIILFITVVPKFNIVQKKTDKLNLVTRENLTGLRVIRACRAEDIEYKKFEQANNELTGITLFTNRAMSVLMPGMQLIMNGLALTIIWAGAYLLLNNTLQLEDMMTFTQYAMQVLMSFMMLSMLFVMLPRAFVSIRRINEVLGVKSEINEPESPTESKQGVKGTVEFKNVSFKYEEEGEGYALKNITFKAKAGETVAIIGSTGSGKTTLVNLIPRLYDATEGEVLVNGVNVREYTFDDLNAKLGYVPQKGMLFSGTIESNLRYAKEDASAQEIDTALDIAMAKDFVEKFDEKLAHPIAQGGKNVSGGQKQRLSIARAIIKNPEIYIFDDSFSALDFKTDKELRRKLKEKMGKATSFIVAQRIGTIMGADKIIVLQNGEMAGIGTHDELMENCEVYREIAYSQFGKEEL